MGAKITYFQVILGATIIQLALIICVLYSMYVDGQLTGSPWGTLVAIFMVIGEPVLRTALAVATTEYLDTKSTGLPLSFGWLSYAVISLVPVFAGVRGVMPEPEIDCSIVNMESGRSRKNKSWMLARLVRDLEKAAGVTVAGLKISIYDAGKPFKSTLLGPKLHIITDNTILVQSTVATVLIFTTLFGYGPGYMITLLIHFGLDLSGLTTQLSAFRAEKFTARADGTANNVYALMRNGDQRHIFIIRNIHNNALDLEDLADPGVAQYDWFGIRDAYILVGTTLGWLLFTILACHLPRGAGFLFGVMALGSISNLIVAACPANIFHRIMQSINALSGASMRDPLVSKITYPIDLTFRQSLTHDTDVMEALKGLEDAFPSFGEKLLKMFFPTRLSAEDELFWADAQASMNRRKHARELREVKDDVKRVRDEISVESEEDAKSMTEEGGLIVDDHASSGSLSSSTSTSSSSSIVTVTEDDKTSENEQGQEFDKAGEIGMNEQAIVGEGPRPKKAYLKSRRRG
ncbi:hypothetical protein P171DRAFT_495283 [Karstenula rhodostoma CBS 690.94]|uniref:Uncharacterized protein n=1 Tax=Karstenula rhodostoma CBS 690.94 TaxID=1392251 RepID=A0A9P4PI05_9PLEO|nr:hypothetical protein P171DRAFT_495283 [Karstenula rhodostoma CBS 690.94]